EALDDFQVAVTEFRRWLNHGSFAPVIPCADLNEGQAAPERAFQCGGERTAVVVVDATPAFVDVSLLVDVVESRKGDSHGEGPRGGILVELLVNRKSGDWCRPVERPSRDPATVVLAQIEGAVGSAGEYLLPFGFAQPVAAE